MRRRDDRVLERLRRDDGGGASSSAVEVGVGVVTTEARRGGGGGIDSPQASSMETAVIYNVRTKKNIFMNHSLGKAAPLRSSHARPHGPFFCTTICKKKMDGDGDVVTPRVHQPTFIFLYGIVAVCVALVVFLYSTRCPCKASRTAPTTPPPPTPPPPPSHNSEFVVQWNDGTPPDETEVHFLNRRSPFDTHRCVARALFATHKRIRVALPKSMYLVRIVYVDGTQRVLNLNGHQRVLVGSRTSSVAPRDNEASFDAPIDSCIA